jgi:hypothetical protein
MKLYTILFAAALAAPAPAHLPPASRETGPIARDALRSPAPEGAQVEDDGCGLITITVKIRFGETYQEARARAERAAKSWKRENAGRAVTFESSAPVRNKAGAPVSAVWHIVTIDACGYTPYLPPAPPPRKP